MIPKIAMFVVCVGSVASFEIDATCGEDTLLREAVGPLNFGRSVALRGYWPNLPSSNSSHMPATVGPPTSSRFPLVIEKASDSNNISDYGIEARRILDIELPRAGVVVFRGLPAATGDDFSQFVQSLGYSPVTLAGGGTARSQIAKFVRTASDEPNSHVIEPHQDMAHNPDHPFKLAFLMIQAPPIDRPDAGGETILTDIRALTQQMESQGITKRFAEKGGVLNKKTLWDANEFDTTFSWQRRFFTEDKSQVESILSALPNTTWYWQNNTLHYEHQLPATRPHYETGDTIFFNGIHTNHRDYFDLAPHIDTSIGSPYDTAFGDGDPIPDDLLDRIRGAWWQNSFALSFRPGDIAIVDNYLTGHGRMPWKSDVQRKMLISHLAS